MEDPENQSLTSSSCCLQRISTMTMINSMKMIYPPISERTIGTPKSEEWTRPIIVSETAVDRIYEIPHGWSLIKTLPFVAFEEFGARLNLTVLNLAAKWFATQDSLSRINQNPALAFYYSKNDSLDVDYERCVG